MFDHAAGAPGAIHLVLQGKGGVGKSFAALHLAQYFIDSRYTYGRLRFGSNNADPVELPGPGCPLYQLHA